MSDYIYKETSYLKNTKNKYIHMIGIGGSSMSGLAEFLMHRGFRVSGSDSTESAVTKRLSEIGAEVSIGHSAENIKDPDLVVYTVAVKSDNPEYMEAVRKNIPIIDRSTLLGELLSLFPKSVSVAGTHGKTTTTSMISNILIDAGKNPNVHIGGIIKNRQSNVILGGDEYFINEACEYYNSFLHFKSYVGVVLNIEADHLDFFGNLENIIESFGNFVSMIPKNGHLIVCKDNQAALTAANSARCEITTYSIESPSADFYARDISFDKNGCGCYALYINKVPYGPVYLRIPGKHNVSNSLAAIAVCVKLGCTVEEAIKGAESFQGTSRRFEIKGSYNNITIVDDYAHHPSEIKATIAAAKKGSYSRIWAIFQPHTYTRAKKLFTEFSKSFEDCYKVLVTDIYAAREKDPGDIHSSQLAEAINSVSQNAVYMQSLESAAQYIKENAQPGDIVITVGAGTVNKICDMLLENTK